MEYPFIILGWKEWISLPGLDVPAVKVKIDTGAATSSIHAYEIEYFRKNKKTYVRFHLHPIQKNKKIDIPCVAELIDERDVKSSSGQTQVRPVIKTTLRIGSYEWDIELNLTNRDSMGMRMLLGRQALKNRILVNSACKFIHGNLDLKRIKQLYYL